MADIRPIDGQNPWGDAWRAYEAVGRNTDGTLKPAGISGFPTDATKFLNGVGLWAVPPGGGGSTPYNGQYVVAPGVNSIKGDTVGFSAGAITATSHNFTDATASFVSGDVGKTIVVSGAGTSATSALQTTIATFVDSTHVTLTAAAGTTASGAAWLYGTNDGAAIQAVMNSASTAATTAGNGVRAQVTVFGPYTYLGTYSQNMDNPQTGNLNFAAMLLMQPNIELVGVGRPRIYANQVGQHTSGQVAKTIIGSANQLAAIPNWAVRGLVIDGGFRANLDHTGVAFPDNSEDFFGIGCGSPGYVEITDNYLVGIWGDAIRLADNGGHDDIVGDIIIERNKFTVFNGQGVSTTACERVRISGNIFYDNQADAGGESETILCEETTKQCVVSDNIIVKAGKLGAFGPNTTITGNFVAPSPGGNTGIEADHPCAITGNVVDLSIYGPDLTTGMLGISINTSLSAGADVGSTIVGNTVILSGGASQSGQGAGINCGGASSGIVEGNTIISAAPTTSFNYFDILAVNNMVVVGNQCQAGLQSIQFGGATLTGIVRDNICAGGLKLAGAGTVQVSGNRFANTVNGSAQKLSALNIGGSGHTIENNYIDGSVVATPLMGFSSVTGPCYLRNNTFVTQSGNIVSGSGSGDIFDDNLVIGAGTLNLNSTQFFKRANGSLAALTYGTAVATNSSLGSLFSLAVTDTVAFTVSNPTNPVRGMQITYSILNSSGGVMGLITWDTAFHVDIGYLPPANGKATPITFFYDGTNWRQTA